MSASRLIVTTTDIPAVRFGMEKAIEAIAKAGFSGCDWSMFAYADRSGFFCQENWRMIADGYRKLAVANGVPFLQAHAPFPTFFPDDQEKTALLNWSLNHALEACSIVEAPYIVFHPGAFHPLPETEAGREEIFKRNVDFYGSFLDRARELGVRICTENMFGYNERYRRITPCYFSYAHELNRLVDALDGGIDVCLDVGHSVLVHDTMQHMARVLGPRLKALHVHSNDGINDRHTAPLIHPMDWSALGHALYDIGFTGSVTLESDGFLVELPDSMFPTALKFLAENAQYVADQIR